MYLQTIHQKKIIDGFISRVPLKSKETLELVEMLTKYGKKEELEKLLKQLNVKYIIVNYNYAHTNYDFSLVDIIKFIKSIKLIEKSERLGVYEVLL
jgi:sulfite reductase alpha subunit-like flavoprotein